jgi:hypothetical protein
VYVSVELDLPTAATWTRSSYDGRWIYREAATSTSCGAVASDPGPPAIYEPNYGLAGCESGPPAGNDPTLYADTNQSVPVTDFTIRAWTTDQLTPALTELAPCAGCSTAPSTAGRVRVTVLVPPRGADPTRPPVKVVLMASLRPSSAYRPHGTQATDPDPIEFAVGSQRLTGQPLGTATQCVQWSRPPGSTSSAAFQCTRTRYLHAGAIPECDLGAGRHGSHDVTGDGAHRHLDPGRHTASPAAREPALVHAHRRHRVEHQRARASRALSRKVPP